MLQLEEPELSEACEWQDHTALYDGYHWSLTPTIGFVAPPGHPQINAEAEEIK